MTILFAGGGTGGHLYPAIAIAEEIKKIQRDVRIVFVGTKRKIEARIVPQKGFEFVTIWISGFSRSLRIGNIAFPLKVIVSLFQSFFVIKKFQPAVVVGTGGYVCGPILYVASLLKIPTVVHESNSYPGVTTQMLAKRVNKVFITFDATKQWLDRSSNIERVGNPTRTELSNVTRTEGARYLGLNPSLKTLFAFGGSLGAVSINTAMSKVANDAIRKNYQVIWQTGENNLSTEFQQNESVKVFPYLDKIEYAYAAADVVISRAGATTLAELTRLGKPAILVPYPFAAANHQMLNARTMEEAGAALVVKDDQLQNELTAKVNELLFNDSIRERMSEHCKKLGEPNAGEEIAKKILLMVQ